MHLKKMCKWTKNKEMMTTPPPLHCFTMKFNLTDAVELVLRHQASLGKLYG